MDISKTACNETLDLYREAFYATADSVKHHKLLCRCVQHQRCVLETLDLDIIANLQSATVLLGIMPTLLANLGPSIAEISLLSTYRPLLSFLLSIGAPAVWPTRVFQYNDPAIILAPVDPDNHPKLVIGMVTSENLSFAISAAQYLLATGAIANVIYTSIDLGEKTILSWGCTTTFLPLVWIGAASVIHVIAATSYAVTRRKVRNKTVDGGDNVQRIQECPGSASHSPLDRRTVRNLVPEICRVITKETTICANQDKKAYDSTTVPKGTMALNVFAGCLSFVHLVFGTVVFSSIQFVSVWDVLNQILWRYILSTVICRLLLIMEFAGLRNGTINVPSRDDDSLGSNTPEVESYPIDNCTN